MTTIRVEVTTVQAAGRWSATWRYDVSPMRGGPCGTTGWLRTEHQAVQCAMYCAGGNYAAEAIAAEERVKP